GELFDAASAWQAGEALLPQALPMLRHQLLSWQERLARHQGPLFSSLQPRDGGRNQQGSLFSGSSPALSPGEMATAGWADPWAWAERLDPLELQAQSLGFWRWPTPPHLGAALYLVIDRPADPAPPLLLYVGETGRADRRWKGEHDCKAYLAAYGEALRRADLEARLSIRFCCDVPVAVRPRRALEQALIQRWLPPFNKESRHRWATPFGTETG
ncbi:MAG: GIY-YIG nuclease family protein, partial [Synechococcaceae cyanobacterium]